MAINWVRLAWTLGFAVLGITSIFIYIGYMQKYNRNSQLVEKEIQSSPRSKRPESKSSDKKRRTPRPRESRRYRRKK